MCTNIDFRRIENAALIKMKYSIQKTNLCLKLLRKINSYVFIFGSDQLKFIYFCVFHELQQPFCTVNRKWSGLFALPYRRTLCCLINHSRAGNENGNTGVLTYIFYLFNRKYYLVWTCIFY